MELQVLLKLKQREVNLILQNHLKYLFFKDGGLEQLLTSFNSSKTQYGFATVAAGAQRKVVLFHWVILIFSTRYWIDLLFIASWPKGTLPIYYTSHY